MKKDNTILWIIGIVVLIFIILPKFQVPTEPLSIEIEYYKNGQKVSGLFSAFISYDQIRFNIYASNTGEFKLSNFLLVDASPQIFQDNFPIQSFETLDVGERNKLILSSDLIDVDYFAVMPQPVEFWIKVSAKDTFDNVIFEETTFDLTFVEDVGEPSLYESLSILELQAESGIIPVIYDNLKMDVFSDPDGYLNTIDVENTNSYYNIDHTSHVNGAISEFLGFKNDSQTKVTYGEGTYYLRKTFNNINTRVTKGTNEIMTSNYGAECICKYIFYYDDGTTGEVVHINNNEFYYARTYTNPEPMKITTKVEVWLAEGGTSGAMYEKLDKIYILPYVLDVSIQTDTISIIEGFTNFKIISYKSLTTGIGTIDADISFDNGANYQTAAPLDTNLAIVNPGTQMILKINLNGEGINNIVETKGYGIALW